MNIIHDLTALEKRAAALLPASPLSVLYELDGGEQRIGAVQDMIENAGHFCRVIDGGSLSDLDRLIDYLKLK